MADNQTVPIVFQNRGNEMPDCDAQSRQAKQLTLRQGEVAGDHIATMSV